MGEVGAGGGGQPRGEGAAGWARVRSPLWAPGFLQTPAEVVYPHVLEVQQLLQPPHLQLQDLSREPDTPSAWFRGAGGTSIHPRQALWGDRGLPNSHQRGRGARGELGARLMRLPESPSGISHL